MLAHGKWLCRVKQVLNANAYGVALLLSCMLYDKPTIISHNLLQSEKFLYLKTLKVHYKVLPKFHTLLHTDKSVHDNTHK